MSMAIQSGLELPRRQVVDLDRVRFTPDRQHRTIRADGEGPDFGRILEWAAADGHVARTMEPDPAVPVSGGDNPAIGEERQRIDRRTLVFDVVDLP